MEEFAFGKKYLNAHEVSERLRISLSTVRHLTRLGKIKAVKIGKQWRYSEDELYRSLNNSPSTVVSARQAVKKETAVPERRIYPRTQCFIQGHTIISNSSQRKWEGSGAILNMSEGGLLFEAGDLLSRQVPFENQDEVSLSLYYFPSSIPRGIQIKGSITHLEANDKTRFGMHFENLDPEIHQSIKKYLG